MPIGDEIPEYFCPNDGGLILTVGFLVCLFLLVFCLFVLFVWIFFLIQSEYDYNCQAKPNGTDPNLVFPFRP